VNGNAVLPYISSADTVASLPRLLRFPLSSAIRLALRWPEREPSVLLLL
jgi:hypothetical protein